MAAEVWCMEIRVAGPRGANCCLAHKFHIHQALACWQPFYIAPLRFVKIHNMQSSSKKSWWLGIFLAMDSFQMELTNFGGQGRWGTVSENLKEMQASIQRTCKFHIRNLGWDSNPEPLDCEAELGTINHCYTVLTMIRFWSHLRVSCFLPTFPVVSLLDLTVEHSA